MGQYCTGCGNEIPTTAHVCPVCGRPRGSPPPPTPQTPALPSNTSQTRPPVSRHLLLAVFLGLFALVLLIVSMMSNGWFVMELHTHLEGNQTTWDVHGSLWYGLREVEQINRSVENGDVVSRNSLALNYADVYGREFPNFMNVATVTYGILWVALILLLVTILLTFLASMGVHGRTSPRTRYLLGAMTVSCIVLMWIAMAHFALHIPEYRRGQWSYQE